MATLTGDSRWSYIHDEHSLTVTGGEPVYALDVADRVVAIETPLIAVPVGVYGRRRCTAVAVDAAGERWRRALEVADCSVVAGWLNGEAVVFLFESGELVWLQRTDQATGVL